MKRALQANINNKIFFIDEDAYALLQNYLRQLNDAFYGPEGKEIVDDIECRVSELLGEKQENGKNVIDIQCIYNVIDTIGSPEELGEQAGPQRNDEDGPQTPPPYNENKKPKKLYRDPNDRVLGGVVGGIAKYLNWNAGVMRLLLVLLALATYVVPFLIFYLIAWMVIPLANTPRKKLEMEGREVTFDSVTQSLRDSAQEQLRKIDSADVGHAATSLLGAIGKVFAGLIGVTAAVIGFASIIGLFVSLFFLINGAVGYSWMTFDHAYPYQLHALPISFAWSACGCMISAIVSFLIVWCMGAVAFGWKKLPTSVLVIIGTILAVLIAAFIIIIIYFINHHIEPFFG